MYLNPAKTATLSRLMGLLNEDCADEELRLGTGHALLRLLDADYFASFVWDDRSASFGKGVTINMDPANLAAYGAYYQFNDPITHRLRDRRVPTLVTQVMAQRELQKTEFFNDFLARDGLFHGVNLHAFDQDQHIGDVRIWRHRRSEAFQKDTLELLGLLEPALTASLKRTRRKQQHPLHVLAPAQAIDASAPLSSREKDVLARLCRGYSDKEIAAELGISFSTVRTHIDRIYEKLGVHTRTQLISRWHHQAP